MASISIKAIVVGNLISLGATFGLGIILVVVLATPYEMDDFERAADIMGSDTGLAVGLALTALISTWAGYLAARIAGERELIHGGLSSIALMALSVYAFIETMVCWPEDLAIYDFVDLAAAPLFSVLGGYLRLRQVRAARP
jgi:hypothetical protein